MTLDEKISRSIDAKFDEIAQLFNDADDAQTDLGVLKTIYPMMRLLQDVKTEIKSIENQVKTLTKPLEDEQEEDKKKPVNDQPVSDPETRKLLPELQDALKQGKKLRDRLRDGVKALPDPTQDNLPDFPQLSKLIPPIEAAAIIAKAIQIERAVKKGNEDFLDRMQSEEFRNMSLWDQVKESVIRDIENAAGVINAATADEMEQLNEELERLYDAVIEELSQRVFQLGEQVQMCCNEMSGQNEAIQRTADSIERGVSMLEPQKTAGQELAIMARQGAILSEVQSLRGLL